MVSLLLGWVGCVIPAAPVISDSCLLVLEKLNRRAYECRGISLATKFAEQRKCSVQIEMVVLLFNRSYT